MKLGPRYKICKRLGSAVFEKCQTQKFVLSEERSSKARRRRRPRGASDFGRQLLEKQKIRYAYGVNERQLSRYSQTARVKRDPAGPAAHLYRALESRLDNIVYRLGFAETRRQARQLVAHGHVLVNGKRLSIPSAVLSTEDIVSIKKKSRENMFFEAAKERLEEHKAPAWLKLEHKKMQGSVIGSPVLEDIDSIFDIAAVLEYYSKR